MKLLIASPIHEEAIQELEKEHEVVCDFGAPFERLIEVINDREVLIFRSGVTISAEVMAQAPNLKLLIRAGSGLDNVDVGYVNQHGLQLHRVPEPGGKAVAELSFGFMIGLSRNLLIADQKTRRGEWPKHELTGYLLNGKTLGILGTGNIGSRVGRMGHAWGMDVIGYDINTSPDFISAVEAQGIRLVSFEEVITTSDYISIHVPLNDRSHYMIDKEALSKVKPGSYLINLARGGVVDEAALYQALVNGTRLAGAALDVHEKEGKGKVSPLSDLPNVILTPHMGAMTVDSQHEIGQRVIQIINKYQEIESNL